MLWPDDAIRGHCSLNHSYLESSNEPLLALLYIFFIISAMSSTSMFLTLPLISLPGWPSSLTWECGAAGV